MTPSTLNSSELYDYHNTLLNVKIPVHVNSYRSNNSKSSNEGGSSIPNAKSFTVSDDRNSVELNIGKVDKNNSVDAYVHEYQNGVNIITYDSCYKQSDCTGIESITNNIGSDDISLNHCSKVNDVVIVDDHHSAIDCESYFVNSVCYNDDCYSMKDDRSVGNTDN